MGVEAGRIAPRRRARTATSPGLLAFATTAPAYADKTNATAIHAALGLPDDVARVRRRRRRPLRRRRGVDGPGRRRAGRAVRHPHRPARARPTRPTAATPPSRSRSATDDVIAEVVGAASVSAEFTDRWRTPGEPYSQLWEERFGEHVYVPLAEQAVTAALEGQRHRRRRARPRRSSPGSTAAPSRPPPGRSAPAPRRSPTTSPTRSATPARPTGRCCSPTCSTAPSPASRSPSSLLADGCDVWLLRTTDALAGTPAGRRPCATASRRPATTCRTPSS